MRKRIITTIITIACVASLVGCGKENVDTNNNSTSSEVSVETPVNTEIVEKEKDVVEDVVETIAEEVKEPEMIPGKTKDSEGRTLMSVQCVMPYMIDKNEEYHGFVGMHCYMYSWAFRNEDGTYAREFVITSSELEPCEYPDKEDWTYSEFGGVTTPRDECFECIKCHILDEGSLDFHLAKIYEEAGKTYDAELFTNRSQNWIETSLAPIAKDTYSIRE